jgi:hypothetical protein
MSRDDSWGISLSNSLHEQALWASESLGALQSFCNYFAVPECEVFAEPHSELKNYLSETKDLLEEEDIEEVEFIELTDFIAANPSDQYWLYAWW